ncbi:MAG: type II toxin-antitoxin system death-on-curing family toxin [Planctomycetaceae bacterium]|nr:type II toxin-antitoxin system death-on-curing family toxin [Planctomycetaceae bacterium]
MTPPLFLDLEHILRLHRSLIEHYGGADGIRDIGLLHSATSMPQASYGGEYLHRNIFEMAAAYLFHIVQNHPFLDGNKRTGAASAIVFLALNDIEIDNDEQGVVDLTLSVATGQAGKAEIAQFFQTHSH